MSEYPFADAPFGATSPIFKCSQKHGVDYGDALEIADFYLRRRGMSERIVRTYNGPPFAAFRNDMKAIGEYWYPIFRRWTE